MLWSARGSASLSNSSVFETTRSAFDGPYVSTALRGYTSCGSAITTGWSMNGYTPATTPYSSQKS